MTGNPAGACVHCRLPAASGERFCCLGCELAAGLVSGQANDGGHARARLTLAGLFAVVLMVVSLVLYGEDLYGPPTGPGAAITAALRWAAALLAVPILALLLPPFVAGAVRGLRRRALGADLLITIAVVAACTQSLLAAGRGQGAVTLDAAAGLLILGTLGRLIEAAAKASAASSVARGLGSGRRFQIAAHDGDPPRDVTALAIRPGDEIQIPMGLALPVDGVVLAGRGSVSEATLTGEASPRPIGPGAHVAAGAVPIDAQLTVRATTDARSSAIGGLHAMVDDAAARRAPLDRLAETMAATLVPVTLLLALAAAGAAWLAGLPGAEAMNRSLAVMLVACPCGFGVAAPLALRLGLASAAQRGVTVRGADVLEAAATVRRVVFDKTGTLTGATPVVSAIEPAIGITPEVVLAVAAALEAGASHPIARAIQDRARADRLTPPLARAIVRTPLGLAGTIAGADVTIVAAPARSGNGADGSFAEARGRLAVTRAGVTLGIIALDESPRPDAREAIDALQALGLEVAIASGDGEARTARVGAALGIAAAGARTPADKLDRIDEDERHGIPTAVVGDGMNDAPALARATLGIAVATACDLPRVAAPVLLTIDDLRLVPFTIALARRTRRVARQSLAWAVAWNAVGLALAAVGWLPPVGAAIALLVSSAAVLASASRMTPPARAPSLAGRATAWRHPHEIPA